MLNIFFSIPVVGFHAFMWWRRTRYVIFFAGSKAKIYGYGFDISCIANIIFLLKLMSDLGILSNLFLKLLWRVSGKSAI